MYNKLCYKGNCAPNCAGGSCYTHVKETAHNFVLSGAMLEGYKSFISYLQHIIVLVSSLREKSDELVLEAEAKRAEAKEKSSI